MKFSLGKLSLVISSLSRHKALFSLIGYSAEDHIGAASLLQSSVDLKAGGEGRIETTVHSLLSTKPNQTQGACLGRTMVTLK